MSSSSSNKTVEKATQMLDAIANIEFCERCEELLKEAGVKTRLKREPDKEVI